MVQDNRCNAMAFTLPFDSLPPPSIAKLKEWLAKNDITYHAGFVIESMAEQSGWTVSSRSFIHVGQHVASIPKTAILSIRNTELPNLAERFPVDTTPSILPLTLALLYEMRAGEKSRFFGYLQSLPRSLLPLPVFWDVLELGFGEDGTLGLEWLRGTEASREMAIKNATGQSFSVLVTFFKTHLDLFPLTEFSPSAPTLAHFLHAYALCSSRAFQTDIYHRPSLLPFADLFNHSCTNHIHLETDDFVCPQCGRLAYCSLHDERNPPPRLMGLDEEIGRQEMDDCLLVVNRAVMDGDEVWNTYGSVGAGLSLVEYGYVDEGQEQGVAWGLADVPRDVEGAWVATAGVELDQETLVGPGEEDKPFGLSATGQVTVRTIASVYLDNVSSDTRVFSRVLSLLEAVWAAEDEEDVPSDQEDQAGALELARAVMDFLQNKVQGLHRPDLTLEQLFELKDEYTDRPGTQLQLLGLTACILERGLLETALERWRAVDEALQPA